MSAPARCYVGCTAREGVVMLSYNSTYTFRITNSPCTSILHPARGGNGVHLTAQRRGRGRSTRPGDQGGDLGTERCSPKAEMPNKIAHPKIWHPEIAQEGPLEGHIRQGRLPDQQHTQHVLHGTRQVDTRGDGSVCQGVHTRQEADMKAVEQDRRHEAKN